MLVRIGYLVIPIKRVGECDRCVGRYPTAWCCTDLPMFSSEKMIDVEDGDYYAARGLYCEKNGLLRLAVVKHCPQYDSQTRRCGIYETRPRICRVFPSRPDQLFLDGGEQICSYSFDLDTDSDIEIDLRKLPQQV